MRCLSCDKPIDSSISVVHEEDGSSTHIECHDAEVICAASNLRDASIRDAALEEAALRCDAAAETVERLAAAKLASSVDPWAIADPTLLAEARNSRGLAFQIRSMKSKPGGTP